MKETNRLSELVELIFSAIEKLPKPIKKKIEKELKDLKDFVMDARPPRLMIIGRRGAGKSSLINAIFNKKIAEIGDVTAKTAVGKWYEYRDNKGALDIFDTRGLGDSKKPEASNFKEAIDEIKSELDIKYPDAIMFLCKGKEVDAHITEDIKNLKEIKEHIKEKHGYAIPILTVITQVDEFTPKRIKPPFENNEEKMLKIQEAIAKIYSLFKEQNLELVKSIPVSAYSEYEGNDIAYKEFWNIDTLMDFLIDTLPKSAQLEFARISQVKRVQVKIAKTLTGSTAGLCAGLAATPIPVADIIPITSAQVAMTIGIGYISGREMTKKTAVEFLSAIGVNIGYAVALREIARALMKFIIPIWGNMISAGIAFSGTWAIGEAGISYFIEKKPIEIAKTVFNDTKKKKEDEYNLKQKK